MEAYCYRIIETSTNQLVDEGVVSESESMIYPAQNTGLYDKLPCECECSHFEADGYEIEIIKIEMSWGDAMKFKVKYDG